MIKREPMDRKEFFSHFSTEISPDLKQFVTDVALLHSRYLFTRRVRSFQFGYCTHCKEEYLIKSKTALRHGQEAICEKCKSSVKVKASGLGRSSLIDQAYVAWYEKSRVDDESITATVYLVIKDFTGSYVNVEENYFPITMYLFQPGKAVMLRRTAYWSGFFHNRKIHYSNAWEFRRTVHSTLMKVYSQNASIHQAVSSISKAVEKTPFQYCEWGKYAKKYPHHDLVEFFGLFAKYPCVEYLMKLGMERIVYEKISGGKTYGAINWRGKSLHKVLKLTNQDAKQWMKQKFKSDLRSLYMYQLFKRLGYPFDMIETAYLSNLINYLQEIQSQQFQSLLPESVECPTPLQVYKYILRQSKNQKISAGYLYSDWKDYLRECNELGMDLSRENVIFPKDLQEAHRVTSQKVKMKRDAELYEKSIERAQQLDKKYRFSYNGFLIRPAASTEELFAEGKALQHCVGTYSSHYANGITDILVIRKVEESDKPFFTMQITGGNVIQCRGFKNCEMTKEVREFVDLFVMEKLSTKKRKRKKTGKRPGIQEAIV